MATPALNLPRRGTSVTLAMHKFETISRFIYRKYGPVSAGTRRRAQIIRGSAQYKLFRARAYRLLTHYVDKGFPEAFYWVLAMRSALPKRTRITLDENPFHWGLLAMSAAAAPVMSSNKLRDLSVQMKQAHAAGVEEDDLEAFIGRSKRDAQHAAIAAITSGPRRA